MTDEENLPTRSQGVVSIVGTTYLTHAAINEVRRLLDQVADTCDAAGVIAGRAGPPPAPAELARLRELSARIDAMVDRLMKVLTGVT